MLVTVGRGGYNLGPADLVVVPLDGSEPWELIADGWDNRRITLHDGDRTVVRVIDVGGMFTAP